MGGGDCNNCDLVKIAKIAESNNFVILSASEESKKNPFVILSEAKYLKNRDSSLHATRSAQNDNLGRVSSFHTSCFPQNDNLGRVSSFHTSCFPQNDNLGRDSSVATLPQNDKNKDSAQSCQNSAQSCPFDLNKTPNAIPRPKDKNSFLWIENWRDTYFLYVWNFTPMRKAQYIRGELKGQVSFRFPLIEFHKNWLFYLAFTDTFYFQLFNEKASSPMRDNDFQPEFLLTYRADNGDDDGFNLTEITTGWRHISNGEIDKAQGGVENRSRGSDRFIIKARFSSRHYGLDIEAFVPTRFYSENRDIYKYLGSFEIKGNTRYGNHLADVSVGGLLGVIQPPYNIAKKHFTPYLRTSYTYKISEYYGIYAQYFVGYGDILYEYNAFSHRIGVGIRIVR